ncbi:MAG: mechanosensitive ion channel family protein [Pirellulaceae bacterium]
MRCIVPLLIALAVIFLSVVVYAQETPELGPLEPSDTSTPAATLNSLIDSCNLLHEQINSGAITEEREAEILPTAERILDCLDLSELPKELRLTAGIESALFLKEVLDRIELPEADEIPAVENPSEDDVEPLQNWQIPHTRIAIARVTEGPRKSQWLFTPESVRNAAQYYRIVKDFPYRLDGPPVSDGLYDAYVTATKKRPTLTADTSSPRGTMTLFLDSCNELYEAVTTEKNLDLSDPEFQRLGQQIVSCLDSSQLPEFSREYFDAEAAVCLKEVLDRLPLPPAEQIPGIESVETSDGSEAVVRWQVPRTQIVISRMEEGPRRGEFLFSSDTVSRAPGLFGKVINQPYRSDGRPVSEGFYDWWLSRPKNPDVAEFVDGLPGWFQDRRLQLALWQWLGLLVVTPIAAFVMFFALRMGRTRERSEHEPINLLRHWLGLAFTLIAVLVPLLFKHIAWEYLAIRGRPLYIVNFCCDLVFLLGVMVLIVRASSRIAESIVALPHISPRGLDANLIRIVCRVLGIVAAVVVLLEGGRYLGFPLTTLIASAGIGGLAIALSAQGLIKGLFGTVTILLDKPYRVGQRILVGEHDGVVEEIGLRSTKLRALDKRLICIPNDQMADARIVNVGDYNRLRRKTTIRIPLDTPRNQVADAVSSIREVLEDHDGMDPNFPPRVFFAEFDSESFDIQMMYWYSPADVHGFLEFSEQVNLEIMQLFEERGIQFSLPARHSFWKHDDRQGPLEVMMTERGNKSPAV